MEKPYPKINLIKENLNKEVTMRRNLILGVFFLFFLLPLLVHADVLILGPADFLPYADNCNYSMNGRYIYSALGASCRSFYAPIHLPDGAKISRVLISYYNNSTTYTEVDMHRMNIWSGSVQTMFSSYTYGGADQIRKKTVVGSTISYKWINGLKYIYYLKLYFNKSGSDLRLYAVKIEYSTS